MKRATAKRAKRAQGEMSMNDLETILLRVADVIRAGFDTPSDAPDREELLSFAKSRQREVAWFLCGVSAGAMGSLSSEPRSFELFKEIVEGAAHLATGIFVLEADEELAPSDRAQTRDVFVKLVERVEALMTAFAEPRPETLQALEERFAGDGSKLH